MTDNEDNLCMLCRKPKSSSAAGFVTQFIDVCHCDLLGQEQDLTITVCQKCGKRISRRSGSITQWVFKSELCDCSSPRPIDKSVDTFVQPAFEGFVHGEDEAELQLDKAEFPIERYKAIGQLGKGAAGLVYLCRDRLLNKKVALKTLLNLSGEEMISFQEEARATAKLTHANIVTILDFGASQGGTPYMVMNYVPGISLDKYLAENGALEPELACILFARLADALAYAHQNNIFHRDLKPSNILLFEQNEVMNVCLIDFGIAKVKEVSGAVTQYQDRTLAGTPAYMSPDTISGDVYDHQSEVYSLGCVLFEALVGKPVFIADTALEMLSLHVNQDPDKLTELLNVEVEHIDLNTLESVVSRCLAKNKLDRYESMEELKAALSEVNRGDSTPSRQVTKETRKSIVLKNFFFWGGCIVLIAAGVAIWSLSRLDKGSSVEHEARLSSIDFKKNTEMIDSQILDAVPMISHKKGQPYEIIGNLQDNSEILRGFLARHEIERLQITRNDFSGDTLQPLMDTPLEQLIFRYCKLDRKSLEIVSKLNKLENLVLSNCDTTASNFEALSNSPKLEALSIWAGDMPSRKLQNIAEIKKLDYLALRDCESIPEQVVEILSRLPVLRYLALSESEYDLKILSDLRMLKALRVLEISRFDDDTINSINKTDINFLILHRNNSLTNKGVLKLTRLKKVKQLTIANCDQVNKTVIKLFAKSNSKVNVKIE